MSKENKLQSGICQVCGCTQDKACSSAFGQTCAWADKDRTLCNFCVGKKKEIDEMSYATMLMKWRFNPPGDPIFQGNTGKYFSKVMAEKKKHVDHVAISKKVGW